jgi:hypothetical protein
VAQASFADRWAQKERELARDFSTTMVERGGHVLPEEAAPFLTFGEFASQPRIWEVFGIPEQWPQAERSRLDAWRMIGSDSAGDPICIEETTGAVWVLNHENRFRTRVFFNSSVPQLAECLLAYMGEKDPERFRAAVAAIDSPALVEDGYWIMAAGWIEQ